MAVVLASEPYNFNTRAVGIDDGHALIPMDEVHICWADEIIFVSKAVARTADSIFRDDVAFADTKKITLDIPDQFEYRNPTLIQAIKDQYDDSQKD
jgi:predicted protein tyrosine phosphatase|tara:strand:+ start:4321 stop:4608 length:288 start_codon:yes stop_codon:yes gene_type:complete